MSNNTIETVIDFSDWSGEQCFIESDGKKFYLNYWVYDNETGGTDIVRTDTYNTVFEAIQVVLDEIKYYADLDQMIRDAEAPR
jgi:hypothetical protein